MHFRSARYHWMIPNRIFSVKILVLMMSIRTSSPKSNSKTTMATTIGQSHSIQMSKLLNNYLQSSSPDSQARTPIAAKTIHTLKLIIRSSLYSLEQSRNRSHLAKRLLMLILLRAFIPPMNPSIYNIIYDDMKGMTTHNNKKKVVQKQRQMTIVTRAAPTALLTLSTNQ